MILNEFFTHGFIKAQITIKWLTIDFESSLWLELYPNPEEQWWGDRTSLVRAVIITSYLSSGIPVKYSANVRKQLHATREDASRCRNHDRMERTHSSLPSAHKAPAMFHPNDRSAALLVPEDDTLAHLKSAEQELVLRVVCLVPKRGHHWLFQRSEKTPCIMQRQKNLHTRKIDLHTSTLRNCLC